MEEKSFQLNEDLEQKMKLLNKICSHLDEIDKRLTKLEMNLNRLNKTNEFNYNGVILKFNETNEKASMEHDSILNGIETIIARLNGIDQTPIMGTNPYDV